MSFPEIIAAALFAVSAFVTYWFRGMLRNAMRGQARKDSAAFGPLISPSYTASSPGSDAMKDAANNAVTAYGDRRLKWILSCGVLLPIIAATTLLVVTSGY